MRKTSEKTKGAKGKNDGRLLRERERERANIAASSVIPAYFR